MFNTGNPQINSGSDLEARVFLDPISRIRLLLLALFLRDANLMLPVQHLES